MKISSLTAAALLGLAFALSPGHAARADQCDDRIKAFNKSADKEVDAGLDRTYAASTGPSADRTAAMCRVHKEDLVSWGRLLAELRKIEAACGARKSADYGVRDVELILTKTEKEIAKDCK